DSTNNRVDTLARNVATVQSGTQSTSSASSGVGTVTTSTTVDLPRQVRQVRAQTRHARNWGILWLVALTLTGLIAGTILFRRTRRTSTSATAGGGTATRGP